MHMSRFQPALIAILAVGLGFSLSSSQAIGYPAGAAVSTGTNPVTSGGGQLTVAYGASGSETLVTAPDDYDLVITDLHLGALSTRQQCLENWEVVISTDGEAKAHYGLFTGWALMETSGTNHSAYIDTNTQSGLAVQFSSGIRIESGQTASIELSSFDQFGSCVSDSQGRLTWTYSGYYAQP